MDIQKQKTRLIRIQKDSRETRTLAPKKGSLSAILDRLALISDMKTLTSMGTEGGVHTGPRSSRKETGDKSGTQGGQTQSRARKV